MKLFFLDGESEDWIDIARMLGYDVGNWLSIEDLPTNVLFIPEYVPVSHIRRSFKKSTIVVVWRDYNLGVMENIKNELNIITDRSIPIQSASWIPESVHDVFSIVGTVSRERTKVIEDDLELCTKSKFERAHIFKGAKLYKGTKFIKEAYVSGCEVSEDEKKIVLYTKEQVAKLLNEFLESLEFLLFFEETTK